MAGRKRILTKGITQAFSLEAEQLEWLKETAGNLNQSASAFLRDTIDEFRYTKEQESFERNFNLQIKPKKSLWQRILRR